jgi:hypothetical protein
VWVDRKFVVVVFQEFIPNFQLWFFSFKVVREDKGFYHFGTKQQLMGQGTNIK